MIKGAVFDMDGLMFDSERLVYENWHKLMDDNGYEYNLDIFKRTIGLRTDESEKIYRSIFGDDFDYKKFKVQSRAMFFDRIEREGVPIKKGLFGILDFLKNSGVKTAVATSTSSQSALRALKIAGVYDYFEVFVCGDYVSRSKPDPEIFLTAAKRLCLAPGECVAFEDSINGIKSAHSAGMTTVMVPDYLQPSDEIRPMINFLCDDLSQAIRFLQD